MKLRGTRPEARINLHHFTISLAAHQLAPGTEERRMTSCGLNTVKLQMPHSGFSCFTQEHDNTKYHKKSYDIFHMKCFVCTSFLFKFDCHPLVQ